MAYSEHLADRVRQYLSRNTQKSVTEKKMFGGLAFMVNDKMCVNVSGEKLMCRFNSERQAEIEQRDGYLKMNMKGKNYRGFCYVASDGFDTEEDFEFWINLCLEFNDRAKSSKKK